MRESVDEDGLKNFYVIRMSQKGIDRDDEFWQRHVKVVSKGIYAF